MKKFLIPLALLTILPTAAQDFKPKAKIDHLAIVVSELEPSVSFYQSIFGLEEIKDGTNQPHIRWFAFADEVELHLIEGDLNGYKARKDIHLALAINDFDAFVQMLDDRGVNYENWPGDQDQSNVRPDGIKQVYLQDPDGYWIEINDASRF